MISLILILIVMVAVLGYATFNLLKKNEKQEDILASYMVYLNKISEIIEMSDNKLKEVDARGHFQADDEVGFFFQSVKQIQEVLNNFKIKNL